MKRLQIMIDEELDDALEQEARREGTSKAGIIRRLVRERVQPVIPFGEDPLDGLIGMCPDVEPAAVDDVVYPR